MDGWNTTFLLGWPIFRGYVSCWYRAVAPGYFPRKQMPELVGWWGGVGWGWWRSLHLHTCDMLRNCWGGGVGWVGDDGVLCTCTHVTCYATAGVVGWGGLGMMTFFALAHMWHATQLLGWWGGVGWGWWRSLHLHTCDMLRNCWGGGVGWVGDDDVLCTCTHVTCYATAGVVGWGPAWFHWSFVCFVNLAALTFFVFRLGTQWIGEMFSANYGNGKTTSVIPLIVFLFGCVHNRSMKSFPLTPWLLSRSSWFWGNELHFVIPNVSHAREDATRVSRQTGVGLHLASIGGKKN